MPEPIELKNKDLDVLEKSLKTVRRKPRNIKNIWTKIKEKITIPDIISLDNDRCECLQFGNPTTDNPSCQYNDIEDTLHCHKCQKTMDVIQVYAIINNLDKSDAIKELVKQFDIEFGEYDKNYIKTENEINELFQDFTEKCHKNLLDSKYYESIKNKRDFTDDTMKRFKIGLFDENVKIHIGKTYSNKLLQKAGFKDFSKKDKEKKGKLFWKFGKRIVYPYLDRNNNPKYFIYRLIDSEPDFNENAKYVKQMKTSYIKEIPFGLNSLAIPSVSNSLIITEGITDAISIIQNKFSCLSPVTVRIKKQDIEKMISYCKQKKVIVVNDNEEFKKDKDGEFDNSGLKGSIDTIKVLIKHNINCFIGIIPNPKKLKKIDLNDYLRPKKEALKKIDSLIRNSVLGLNFLINIINDKSTQEDLIEILEVLPENDIVIQGDSFRKLAKKRKLSVSEIKEIYKQCQKSKHIKKQNKEPEKEDIKDIFERISLDIYDIEIRKEGIFKVIWRRGLDGEMYSTETPILDGKLEILFTVYDNRLNVKRFTFLLDGVQYNTYTVMNMISKFEANIYEGSHGRDIIKKVFNYFSNKIESRNPEYIAGFNNGWKLPQLEKDNGYTIIVYTDFERKVYENMKNFIKEYSDKEKEKIIKKFQQLIQITQNRENLVILLGWSLSAPFRLAILEYCDIFPHLFNVGARLSGKNALEKTFITDFYKAYNKMLSPNTLESISRLEDHLSESTFPHVITEIHKVKNINAVPILKDHATGISDFERKKSFFELGISKEKIAGISLDSNNPLKILRDPALNTKIIINDFKKQVSVDDNWKKLNYQLKKEKLFSFIYTHTKNWKNKNVFQQLKHQRDRIQKELGILKLQETERENPRIISTFQILLFGLELLKDIFDIEINNSIETILNPIKLGRRYIPMELKDQLFAFCKSAIEFDMGYDDDFGNYHKGDNPKYLTGLLELNKKSEHYCFTQNNLRDFNEYSREKYSMKELINLVSDALEKNNTMEYVNKYFNGIKTRYIQIKKGLF